jgi:hypothetical protein
VCLLGAFRHVRLIRRAFYGARIGARRQALASLVGAHWNIKGGAPKKDYDGIRSNIGLGRSTGMNAFMGRRKTAAEMLETALAEQWDHSPDSTSRHNTGLLT